MACLRAEQISPVADRMTTPPPDRAQSAPGLPPRPRGRLPRAARCRGNPRAGPSGAGRMLALERGARRRAPQHRSRRACEERRKRDEDGALERGAEARRSAAPRVRRRAHEQHGAQPQRRSGRWARPRRSIPGTCSAHAVDVPGRAERSAITRWARPRRLGPRVAGSADRLAGCLDRRDVRDGDGLAAGCDVGHQRSASRPLPTMRSTIERVAASRGRSCQHSDPRQRERDSDAPAPRCRRLPAPATRLRKLASASMNAPRRSSRPPRAGQPSSGLPDRIGPAARSACPALRSGRPCSRRPRQLPPAVRGLAVSPRPRALAPRGPAAAPPRRAGPALQRRRPAAGAPEHRSDAGPLCSVRRRRCSGVRAPSRSLPRRSRARLVGTGDSCTVRTRRTPAAPRA